MQEDLSHEMCPHKPEFPFIRVAITRGRLYHLLKPGRNETPTTKLKHYEGGELFAPSILMMSKTLINAIPAIQKLFLQPTKLKTKKNYSSSILMGEDAKKNYG